MSEESVNGSGHDSGGSVSVDSPQFDVLAKNPRRVEVTIVVAFLIATAGFAGFGAAYWQNSTPWIMGAMLGVGLCAFGFAFVAWGKYLMPRGPFEEPRQMMEVAPEARDELVADFSSRGRVAIHRRKFLVGFMSLAGAVIGIVAAFPLLRSLGPLPKKSLYKTTWRKGSYLTQISGARVHVDDVEVGGIVTVFPESDVGGALSQTVLIHYQLDGFVKIDKPNREDWGPHGYVAFSKVCTHAGCPVALYEEQTGQLLCPCHQSLFDVKLGAEPIFGPAPRPLAQLPLWVDSEGYIRAQDGYDEPIGPGFWERGGLPT